MSIALAAMSETFIANANAAGIPMEVLHRVAAMASGGMDTLPHNGAVITLLAVTGLTTSPVLQGHLRHHPHQDLAVFVVIGQCAPQGRDEATVAERAQQRVERALGQLLRANLRGARQ
jgi:H+/gluconate symporter-like permease